VNTIEMLKDALDYCPNTGVFTWRERPPSHFKNVESCARENARHANKVAGSIQSHARAKNYKCIHIQVFNRHYMAHRLAWAFTHGEFPKEDEQIDHINGDATDNRIDNLRLVSMQENNRNKGLGRNNKTGITGVSWKKKYQKWYAFIKVDRVDKHLGCFSTIFEAACARKSAEREYGFHGNHGSRRAANQAKEDR